MEKPQQKVVSRDLMKVLLQTSLFGFGSTSRVVDVYETEGSMFIIEVQQVPGLPNLTGGIDFKENI